MNKVKCNLYVIGDPGVGKTFLIKTLEEYSYHDKESPRNQFRGLDWIIRTKNNLLEVAIKEQRKLDLTIIKFIKERNQGDKFYILFVVPIKNRSITSSIKTDQIKQLKNLSQNATIIVAFTFDSLELTQSKSINVAKRALPFVEYFVPIHAFQREYESLYQFSYILRRIIINSNSSELEYAKNLIRENLEKKEPILDLGNCGLTSLNEVNELFLNVHLKTLILSNEWGEYQNGGWKRRISNNKLEPNILFKLPKEISKLKNIETLICGGNWKNTKTKSRHIVTNWHITEILSLSQLKNLTILNLSNNEITSFTPISKLNHLIRLYLNNNTIKYFPNIKCFPRLKELYLSNNNLSDVKFLNGHSNILTIDLHSNKIKDLTPIKSLISKLGIKDSRWENNSISISNNQLTVPPIEIVIKGKRNVLAYFAKLEAEEKINLNPYTNKDIKLIMVGNSNVGKSTYVHWLKKGEIKKDIPTTHWLDLGQWVAQRNTKKYNVRIFDFGGQEYYHDTHHLFFTNRTAYALIWDSASNQFNELEVDQIQSNGKSHKVRIETFPLEYWLDSIRYHTQKRRLSQTEKSIENLLNERDEQIEESIKIGSDWTKHIIDSTKTVGNILQEEENILVMQNKVDNKGLKTFINEELLTIKYPKIYDFTHASVHKNRGLESSKEMLFDIFDSLEISHRQYPGTWNYIKQDIEKQDFKVHFTIPDFLDYCNKVIEQIPEIKGKTKRQIKNVLFNKEDAEVFASFLADIGLCLYYPESATLKDRIFLNQAQILDSLNKILRSLNKSTGEVSEIDILTSLGKLTGDQVVSDIIDLMLHFKILFKHPIKNKKTFVAPLYLPQEPPQSIKLFHSLFEKPAYRFQYETFIHKSVILDFFYEYGEKALKETNDDTLYYYWRTGIVVKDETTGEIVMVKFIPGNNESKSAFLDVYVINNSNDDFTKGVVAYIDNMNKGIKVRKLVPVDQATEYVPLEIIHQNEKANNMVFHFENKYYRLTAFKKYLNTPMKMKKIFISYSKQDLRLVNKFIEHLSALKKDGKVAHWYCSTLEAGSDWNNKIQEQLDDADIICFMISPNFMKTDYILEHEVSKAFEKKKKNPDFKIVPIILDFCRWSTTNNDLSKYTALPYTAKPILDFDNQNMGWYIVEECLRLMIENDLDPLGSEFYSDHKLPPDIAKQFIRIVEGKVDKNSN